MFERGNKRGQITIFVIIGIVLVAAVGLYFVFRNVETPGVSGVSADSNANSFLSTCIEDSISSTVREISLHGGQTNPSPSIKFQFENEEKMPIAYLCYNRAYNLPCVNQNPLLIKSIGEEIKKEISDSVEGCFEEYVNDLSRQGYDVTYKYNDFDLELEKNKITLKLDAEATYSKNDQTTTKDDFSFSVFNDIYDLASVAKRIVLEESLSCEFDESYYSIFYPEYSITKTLAQNESHIYTIEKENSINKFRFAIRGCVNPPSY